MNIGILGAGQLARMLNHSASSLGINIFCLDPSPEICAQNANPCLQAAYDNLEAIDKLLSYCDLITFENENIPLLTAEYIHQKNKLFPSPKALYHSQDRLLEKQFLHENYIKIAPFHDVHDLKTFQEAANILGFPMLLKTRRFGYDGKGQYRIETEKNGKQIIQGLLQANSSISLIAEGIINFKQELSIIAARNSKETVFYPLVANKHEAGILRYSKTLFSNKDFLKRQKEAEKIAETLLKALDYRGILSIELFETEQGLLVNEIAPRVHNSGHWTIEGSHTSQFENHLRAILDLPLGNTQLKGHSMMINAIGTFPDLSDLLAIPFCHVHDYQKKHRPLRKVGHVTLNHEDREFLEQLFLKNTLLQTMIGKTKC